MLRSLHPLGTGETHRAGGLPGGIAPLAAAFPDGHGNGGPHPAPAHRGAGQSHRGRADILGGHFIFFVICFLKKRQKFCRDVGMRGVETFGAVDFTDSCLDACRVSEGAEELVGGEMSEPDAVHTAALSEHEFAGEKC